VRARAAVPAAAVEPAFEGRAGLGRAEAEARTGVVRRVVRVRVDGRVGRGQVDGPGVARRAPVRVAGRVGRAHIERVAAGAEGRQAVRARAAVPAAAVQATLEGRAGLGRAEPEAWAGVVRRIVRM